VLKIQPLSAEARFNLAIGLLKQGKEDDALQQLAIIAEYRSDYLPAHLQYGLLLYRAGRTDEAIEQFREVLRLDPGNVSARSALLQMGAGQTD
jgi:Flp pilus assembly protein TadD